MDATDAKCKVEDAERRAVRRPESETVSKISKASLTRKIASPALQLSDLLAYLAAAEETRNLLNRPAALDAVLQVK